MGSYCPRRGPSRQTAGAAWLVDTGASNHVTGGELSQIGEYLPDANVQTAGGLVQIEAAGEADTPLGVQGGVRRIPGSPNLLSVGLLTQRDGFSFRWDAGEQPVLTTPVGDELVLETVNNVPVIGCAVMNRP